MYNVHAYYTVVAGLKPYYEDTVHTIGKERIGLESLS